MPQINSGYIVNQGLDVVFGLINNSQTLMNLDVFRFGIGKEENHIVQIIDLSDRTFSYSSGTFSATSGDNLPVISDSEYPYIWINSTEYEVTNYNETTNEITINTSYRDYTGSTSDITISGAIASIPNSYQVFSNNFLNRTNPELDEVVTLGGLTGNISQITRIDDNTVDVECIIPQDTTLSEAIFFDEVYLYGNSSGSTDEDDMKLIFVAQMTFGSGVYTGLESNVFNIQISLSNVFQTDTIEYNINNLSLKKDIDVIQLMLLYIMSVKQRDIRDINTTLTNMDSLLDPFKDIGFVDSVVDKINTYITNKIDSKYSQIENNLVEVNIDLINSVQLNNLSLDSIPYEVREDIRDIIGIVPKYIKQSSDVYVGGYPQNTLFYVSNGNRNSFNNNRILAYDLDSADPIIENRYITIKTLFASIIINENDVLNINVLNELIDGYEPTNV